MFRFDSIRRAPAPVAVMLIAIAMLAGCAADATPMTTPSDSPSASASPEFLELESRGVVIAPGNPETSYVATVVNPNAELSIFGYVELASLDDAAPEPAGVLSAVFPPGETVIVFDSWTWGITAPIANPGIAVRHFERDRGQELFAGRPYAGDTRLEVAAAEMGQNTSGQPRIDMELVSTLDVAVKADVDVVIRGADGAVIYAAPAAHFDYVPARNRSTALSAPLTGFPGVPAGGSRELWPRVSGPDQTQELPVQSTLAVGDIEGFGEIGDERWQWPDGYGAWATALLTNTGTEPSLDMVIFRFFDGSGTYRGSAMTPVLIQPGETRRVPAFALGVRTGGITRVEVGVAANPSPIGTNGGNLLLEDFTASGRDLVATVVSTLPMVTWSELYGICWAADGSPLSLVYMDPPEQVGAGLRKHWGMTLPEIPVGTDHCTLEVIATTWERLDHSRFMEAAREALEG